MRLMSFFHTQDQIRARTKFETRRVGWEFARPGMKVDAVLKSMGRKRNEPLVYMGVIEFVEVEREPLNAITPSGCVLEGFPDLTPGEFVTMFCKHMHTWPKKEVTRIRFCYHVGAGVPPIYWPGHRSS